MRALASRRSISGPGPRPSGRPVIHPLQADRIEVTERPAEPHRYPGHDLVNLRANAPVGPRVIASVRCMNLPDERHTETSQYTTARGEEYAPGLPRTWYGALQYNFR